jgi:hypothetical protein
VKEIEEDALVGPSAGIKATPLGPEQGIGLFSVGSTTQVDDQAWGA